MPLRALRPNRSERDLKRRSTLDPAGLFARGDRTSRPKKSTELLAADHPARAAVSEDGTRPDYVDIADQALSATVSHDGPPPTPPVQESTPYTRRFSLMRFRHASDSQLSVKAKEHAEEEAPPVPQVPATSAASAANNAGTATSMPSPGPAVPVVETSADPAIAAPAIITTAPTVVDPEHDENQQGPLEVMPKKRGRLGQLSLRRRSFDPTSTDRPSSLRKSMDKKSSSDIKRGPFGFKKSQVDLTEDPGRLSTGQRPPAVAESPHENAEGTPSLSLPRPRASESSRSDGSSGGHVSFENTPRPSQTPKSTSSRFNFGRRKQRQSLFPLPVKISPPEFPDTAPATPRASTSGVSTGSANHSPNGESPPLTATNHSRLHDAENGASTPPIPSPSQVALAAASMNLATPGSSALLRNDSTKSFRSTHSSPNGGGGGGPKLLGLRGRSSTMGSLGGRSDDAPPPTPPYANTASGRNSTSTVGRSSFSNLFSLSARFRQNSEPHSPRHGSPAHALIGTPGLSSHQNSLNISREALVLPKREEGETPGRYLERMEENNIEKSAIPSFLTKTDDPFMLAVLRSYMRKFAFFGDPIDMAIRKLLMQVELPKETQQIDRVLQGFADRYHECNPGIYIGPDKAYFISFSIVILHTDFFNKNNKRKMQRADYIKNSSCEGVSEDALGCIYDNIIYTPFIHIEDEVDLKHITSRKSKRTMLKGPMNDPARKATKEPVDPYTMIFEGKLDALRPNIKDVMNLDDPYDYVGTNQTLELKNLHKTFSKYGVIQIVSSRSRPEAFMSQAAQENPQDTNVGIVEMPVTKVGVVWRKDAKRKKTRSPWQEWGAVLTRSGLSLFRNSNWAKGLVSQHEQHQKHGENGPVVFQPPLQDFKQDHIIPMDGAVALVDNTYRKHKNAFVMFSKAGEEVFLADNEKDLNDWLAMINYSAAFETLGVRPRGMIGGLYEGQRSRAIRHLESSHSTNTIPTATGEVTISSGKIDNQFAQQMVTARRDLMNLRIQESEERIEQSIRQLEARLRDARHLQILAPIQPKTRELVVHAAGRLAAKLKWIRIEIWRMKCHRDILAHELEEEKQSTNERQSRMERIASTSQSPQPQLSPHQSTRNSKIGSLARLSSKASSITGGHKPPLSPSASSARPGTKSSRDTDFGEDNFKTPPETSRQSSPNHPSAQFNLPPMSFTPESSHRRPSVASSAAQSPRLAPQDHRQSVSTVGGHTLSSDGASDAGYLTPPQVDGDREPRTPETSNADGLRLDPGSESETDQPPAAMTGSPESRSRVRKSLHRTLRETGSSSHRRSHKGRDSASTVLSDDTQESEGLTRGKGSFTVHGKKASVITFGPDWNNQSAEERLRIRKQAQEAMQESNPNEGRDGSIMSSDTATIPKAPTINEPEETTPRRSSVDMRKQRHVSSQTITPANYQHTLADEVKSDDGSDMSDIAEESPVKERDQPVPVKDEVEEESSRGRAELATPRSQAVEA